MMTPRQFDNCVKGYEIKQRTGWEQTRMLAYFMIKPHVKKGKHLSVKDVMRFPWESAKNAPKSITKNEAAEIRRLAREFDANIKKKNYTFKKV